MKQSARLMVGACLVVMAITSIASPAFALRSLQSSSYLEVVSGTGARVSFEEGGGFLRTVCAGVTLRGHGGERVAKTSGASVGTVTEGRTAECTAFGFIGATVIVQAEAGVPFTATYNSIGGTLPLITFHLLLLLGARWQIATAGRTCRYEGSVGFLAPVAREARGSLTFEGGSFLAEPRARLLAGSTAECPRQGELRGSIRLERPRTLTLV